MGKHVCPWWIGYLIDNRFRRLLEKPENILSPYVRGGMIVLDIGSGMGFFTIPAARMVGENGKVIAIDVQEKMLKSLTRRAQKAGLAHRVHTHLCSPNDIGISEPVDVCLAFNVVHEVPNAGTLFAQIRSVLKSSGKILFSEPGFHVSEHEFQQMLKQALSVGLKVVGDLGKGFRRSAVLEVV